MKRLIILASMLTFLASCKKTNENVPVQDPQKDSKENAVVESYSYSRKITVTDKSGKYFIAVDVKANTEEKLNEVIAAKPYLTVGEKVPATDGKAVAPLLTQEKTISAEPQNKIEYHLTAERNLPAELTYGFHTSESGSNTAAKATGCGTGGDPYKESTFQDDLANVVYTSNSTSCPIQFTYYSKGCCWYSVGYYDQGWRNLYNGSAHTFYRTTYSPYQGVKVKAARYFDLIGLTWYKVS